MCAHMIQLCCTLICTSVYNYVQLQSLVYCLLWWIYIVLDILNLNSYYTIGMYYICPGPVFQREFNCDDYFVIGLTSFGNFENCQICICILHHGKMFVTVRKCFEYPNLQKNLRCLFLFVIVVALFLNYTCMYMLSEPIS